MYFGKIEPVTARQKCGATDLPVKGTPFAHDKSPFAMKIATLFGAIAVAGAAADTLDAKSTADLQKELDDTRASLQELKQEIQADKKRQLLSAAVSSAQKTAHEFLVDATDLFTEDRRKLSADNGMISIFVFLRVV